jgi:hypothetical protein
MRENRVEWSGEERTDGEEWIPDCSGKFGILSMDGYQTDCMKFTHLSNILFSWIIELERFDWKYLSEAFALVTNSNQKWSSDALLISGQDFMKKKIINLSNSVIVVRFEKWSIWWH